MTKHTDFYTRLDALEQRVDKARASARAATAETDAQLKQRIEKAQADMDQSAQNAKARLAHANDNARTKWTQLKADASTKVNNVKANIEHRNRQMDAKVAAKEADWAEADSADALDFADWAVDNAQLAMLDAVHARAYADELAKAAANS